MAENEIKDENEIKEESEQKTLNTRSFRVDENVENKIKDLTKNPGFKNQNQVFEALLAAYELQQGAVIVPDAKMDIDDISSHIVALQKGCTHLLDINAQTEDRVRQEFARRLDNNEKQISDLLATRDAQKKSLEELKEKLKMAEGQIAIKDDEITSLGQRLEDKVKLVDSLTARIPEQAEMDAKIKKQDAEIESLKETLSKSEKQTLEAEMAAQKANVELETTKRQAEDAKKAYEADKEVFLKQAAADLKAAVADARQEERDKAQAKQDKLQDKIDECRSQIDEQRAKMEEYREQIEQYKAQIAKLEVAKDISES